MSEPTKETTPAAEVAEPQNELTKKFTEAEWTALKELRVRLWLCRSSLSTATSTQPHLLGEAS